MKKLSLLTLLTLIFSFTTLNAQNDHDQDKNHQSSSKFSFTAYGGIGYAILDNQNQPNYNLDASTADFLVHYHFGKHYGIATGIGINELTGNGFFYVDGPFYHERANLKIPVLLDVNYNLSPKIGLVANVGVYGQTVYRDQFTFLNGGKVINVYEGWNFGFQSAIGISYNFNQNISLGVMFNSQWDFNRLEVDRIKRTFADQQKISRINTLGLLFTFNLLPKKRALHYDFA